MSDDPRLGSIIKSGEPQRDEDVASVVLIGFPHDEGVRRNGGRVGARHGPSTVRRFLPKMGTVVNDEYRVDLKRIELYDAGDVAEGEQLEAAHQQLLLKVQGVCSKGAIPFVIGGGNDQSYPNARGMMNTLDDSASVLVVNVDAHLDVRPLKEGKVHSGSPFFQLLNDGDFKRRNGKFCEFACQGSQCSSQHAAFVTRNGGELLWLKSLRDDTIETKEALFSSPSHISAQFSNLVWRFQRLLDDARNEDRSIFVSFDLDSVQGADARSYKLISNSGVSAVATVGITAQEALLMCFVAGANANVKLFDLSEYNPTVEDWRTGRLVTNMFYYFCMGVASRGPLA